jgi:hypothetical protein
MILTGENRITLRKTCPTATLSNVKSIQDALKLNPGLCGEKPANTAQVMLRPVNESGLLLAAIFM